MHTPSKPAYSLTLHTKKLTVTVRRQIRLCEGRLLWRKCARVLRQHHTASTVQLRATGCWEALEHKCGKAWGRGLTLSPPGPFLHSEALCLPLSTAVYSFTFVLFSAFCLEFPANYLKNITAEPVEAPVEAEGSCLRLGKFLT